MKKVTLSAIVKFFGAVILLTSIQCNKIDDPFYKYSLAIEKISPTGGSAGTEVIFTGTGFSAVAAENHVKFNGEDAEVVKATETALTVKAPAGGTTGKVSVTLNNNTAEGPVFTYLAPDQPQILSISPEVGWDYTLNSVTINGKNFGNDQQKVTVTFDGKAASIQSFSGTKLVVSPPVHDAGKVNVIVKVDGVSSNIVQYTYQQKPVILHIEKHNKGNTIFYFLTVSNLDARNSALHVQVNGGKEVRIDSVYRKGSDEYEAEPKGDKIALKEENVDQFLTSFYIDFIVSSNGVESEPVHYENDPIINKVTSPGKEDSHIGANDTVTITGKYFGPEIQNSKLELWTQSIPVTQINPDPKILSWSNSKIKIIVPAYNFNYDQQLNIGLKLWIKTSGQSSHNANIDVIFEVEPEQSGDYIVSTLAGSVAGFKNGSGADAQFNGLWHIALDSKGNIYATDRFNYRIRKITPDGVVSTFAGNGVSGQKDGPALQAEFYLPIGITVDEDDNVFVFQDGGTIRKITQAGIVSTLSLGQNYGSPGGIESDKNGKLYFVTKDTYKVLERTASGAISLVAGTGQQGYHDDVGANAIFSDLSDLSIDAAGDLYIADIGNYCIRKITFNHNPTYSSPPVVSTVSGKYTTHGYKDGNIAEALFSTIYGVDNDKNGKVYVSDAHRIRMINVVTGIVSTIAGSDPGYADGPGKDALFNQVYGIALDKQRNILYVADVGNNRIRKILLK